MGRNGTRSSRTGAAPGGAGGLIVGIGAFVLVGMPMVYYLWTVANDLLSGRPDGGRVAIGLLVAAVFAALLTLLARAVRRWEGTE